MANQAELYAYVQGIGFLPVSAILGPTDPVAGQTAVLSSSPNGVYNAVPLNLTNGQSVPPQLDSHGRQFVDVTNIQAGSDLSRNVINTLQGPFQYNHIITLATFVISNVPCFFHSLEFSPVATGVIKIYDDIAANAGTLIRTLTSPASPPYEDQIFYDINTSIGLTIVTSVVIQEIMVLWRP